MGTSTTMMGLDGSNRLRQEAYSLVNSTGSGFPPMTGTPLGFSGRIYWIRNISPIKAGESATRDNGIPAPPRTYGVNFEANLR
jgi:hypothetical protein